MLRDDFALPSYDGRLGVTLLSGGGSTHENFLEEVDCSKVYEDSGAIHAFEGRIELIM